MEHADAILMAASDDVLTSSVSHMFPSPRARHGTKSFGNLANAERPMLLFDLVTACCPVPHLKYLNVGLSKTQRVHPGALPDANVAVTTLVDALKSVHDVRPCTLAATLHASSHIVNDNPTWSWTAVRGKLATKLRFTPASFDGESSLGLPLYCRTVAHQHGGGSPLLPDVRKPSAATARTSKWPSAQLSLVYNSASVAASDLAQMAVAATRKAHAQAFLHHFPFEIGNEWIPDACEAMWESVDEYREYLQ
ncbi:hypothetical protein BCR44DRAFT_1440908 [Catenaria anguillulae PL171]|uniref:Uncharacterized protein n=1 Tax=Catenaria anguillulae PL171 TaxID=765915 RepID=A0A1Y2HC40_9FUNG|nr:hypothetical protein BCR44DRAFT_1440908 [Catenaria anguillulae PL171]